MATTINATIQCRQGNEVDFDASKMLPGEWAVSLDTKYVRMCFSPGVCVRMATYEAFEQDMAEIRDILLKCKTIEAAVNKINKEIGIKAQAVAEDATQVAADKEQTRIYRDEAKQFRDEAESIVGIDIATTEKAGIVKPDGTTITVDADGTIHSQGGGKPGTIDYTELINKPKINSVELNGDKSLDEIGIWTGTTAEYNKAIEQGTLNPNSIVNITDDFDESQESNYPKLDTLEQVNSNNDLGKVVDAMVIKELNNNINNIPDNYPKVNTMQDLNDVTNLGKVVDAMIVKEIKDSASSSYPKINDMSTLDSNMDLGKVVDALVVKELKNSISTNYPKINTVEELNSTTEVGKVVDATVVKEISNKFSFPILDYKNTQNINIPLLKGNSTYSFNAPSNGIICGQVIISTISKESAGHSIEAYVQIFSKNNGSAITTWCEVRGPQEAFNINAAYIGFPIYFLINAEDRADFNIIQPKNINEVVWSLRFIPFTSGSSLEPPKPEVLT